MTPFLGQLVLTSFNYAPKGYALCNGQLLPINQNQALFSLVGTTFGGNGVSTFGLPDMRGRVALSTGTNASLSYVLGQLSGTESVSLLTTQMPTHNHTLTVSNLLGNPNANPVGSTVTAQASGTNYYNTSANNVMAGNALGTSGGSQPHENRSPYLTLNWLIALQGIFPSRN